MTAIEKMFALAGLGFAVTLGACSSQEATAAPGDEDRAAAETAATSAAPTGNVVEVKMITDGAGNYFDPQNVTVSRGDVVRFVLVSGVHNVSFPAASNPGAQALPEATPYLQLPGQTHDLAVDVAAGEYVFQCDPHAALGMVGKLTVQ